MPLQPGARFGSIEVVERLGVGGMGEVYRARDTKLNRNVALKVLPAGLADDADRLIRFEREAQALAALNHPNIAQVYSVEHGAAGPALVMELVEGPTLEDTISGAPGPQPRGASAGLEGPALQVTDALAIARQIVDALEAAHERGIVHRDLKPANIKITPDGVVKVLDFGLAKALDASASDLRTPGPSDRGSTMTSPAMTAMGVILGTAAYMAPEQARGRPVDRRADIWAFGVVLYEMLTRRQPFSGDTVSDVLAAVLTRELDWAALPPRTPAGVRRLLARCLERDPKRRLRDIGDARWDLDAEDRAEPAASDSARRPRPAFGWLPWVVAAAGAGVALLAISTRPSVRPASAEGFFTIDLPADAALVTNDVPSRSEGPLAISPDGRHVVYVAPNGSRTQLYVRTMTDLTPRALPGTDGARLPFFSPDGQAIGFFADGKLKRTALAGGTPATLADAPGGTGASWGTNGEIVFAPTGEGLFVVPEAGGAPRRLTALDAAAGDDWHGLPQLLPGGLLLFTVVAWSRETSEIVVLDVDTGERRLVQEDTYFARYVPAADGGAGHLVFVRDGALMAAPFDPATDARAGTPVAIIQGVRTAQFAISANGVLVYAPGPGHAPDYSLVWVDRAGVVTPINDLARGYEDLHLSPDGRQVALTIEESGVDSPAHVWLAGTERGTLSRLTFDGLSRDPVFAPDGQSVVFGSKRGESTFGLYVQRLDGQSPAELLWASPVPIWPDPQSWTPDGGTVVFTTKGAQTADDIWTVSLDDSTARAWLETPAIEWAGRLSPDGRWMAYVSTESGRDDVYVRPFPGPGTKRLVSVNGGINPIWSRDGRELFYRRDDEVLVVEIDTTAGFTAGKPVVMFSGRYRMTGRDFDVSPDGRRFVMMLANEPRTTATMRVLLNWWQAMDSRLLGSR